MCFSAPPTLKARNRSFPCPKSVYTLRASSSPAAPHSHTLVVPLCAPPACWVPSQAARRNNIRSRADCGSAVGCAERCGLSRDATPCYGLLIRTRASRKLSSESPVRATATPIQYDLRMVVSEGDMSSPWMNAQLLCQSLEQRDALILSRLFAHAEGKLTRHQGAPWHVGQQNSTNKKEETESLVCGAGVFSGSAVPRLPVWHRHEHGVLAGARTVPIFTLGDSQILGLHFAQPRLRVVSVFSRCLASWRA